MTWANLKSTGRGGLEFRVSIEGLGTQFVSDPGMEVTKYGQERVAGLLRDGLVLDETVDVPGGEIEVAGMTVQIVDRQRDRAVTKALAHRPEVITYLKSDLAIGASSMDVLSTTGFATNDYVHTGTETLLVSAVTDGDTLALDTGTTGRSSGSGRNKWDTIEQAHYTQDGEALSYPAVSLTRPLTLEGRRARLYAYGRGDSLTGDGTPIWLGVCATDAKLNNDGSTWSITVDSIAALLQQDLGADLEEEVEPRGIYYHAFAPLVVTVAEAATAAEVTRAPATELTFRIPEDVAQGFFGSNDELCRTINTHIAANWTGNTVYRAIPIGDDDWFLEATITSTARYPLFGFTSRVDGYCGNYISGWIGVGIEDTATGSAPPATVANSETYRTINAGRGFEIAGARTVPRGYWSSNGPDGWETVDYATRVTTAPDPTTYPPHRVYLGGTLTVSGLDAVEMQWASGASHSVDIDAQDASARFITTARWRSGAGSRPALAVVGDYGFTREWLPTLKFRRHYATGGLDDWRDAIVDTTTGSPVHANQGAMPFLTDTDLASWTTEVDDAARAMPWADTRRYIGYESVKVADFLAHECRLIGVYPALNASGQLRLRRIQAVADTETSSATLDATKELADDGMSTWERGAVYGSINTVIVRTGYNALTDDHEGRTYVVRDVTGFGLRKAPRELKIEPVSEETGLGGTPSYRQIVDLARPVLGLFGGDYSIVTVDVPMSLFDTLVGDVVKLTLQHVPDVADGTRGITDKNAIVIGRRWDLDRGRGVFRLIYSNARIAGYTPSVSITTATNVTTNQWDLTVTSNDPAAVVDWFKAGDNLSDHFTAGDQVRKTDWETATPTELAGTVDSVTDSATSPATGTIRVTFDGVYTHSSDDILTYDVASQATTSQDDYMYLADATGRVAFGTEAPAREMAP